LKDPEQLGVLFAISLFLGMLVLLEVGRRVGTRRLRKDHLLDDHSEQGLTMVDGVLVTIGDSPLGKQRCPAFTDMF